MAANDSALRARAAKLFPGGMYGHLSTRLLPAAYPQFASRARGAHLWDADGRRYLDLMCGYGPNLFGYGDPRVDRAVIAQLGICDTTTAPSSIAVDAAEAFVDLVGHADWAIFCKNGTDATTTAMSVARAQTGRRKVLLAQGAYHGAAPWCTPVPAGTLPEDRAHQISYSYNDVERLEAAANAAGDDLAAIFAAPFRHDAFMDQVMPTREYARRARALCNERGAMLVIDDVRAGLRLARDCSWSLVDVAPDMSCWGKAIANGHALSAVLGSNSCRAGAEQVFVSGSFWLSAAPLAAALATLRLVQETEYLEHTIRLGERLRTGFAKAAVRHGLRLRQTGPVQMPQILFDDDPDFRIGFAWGEVMLERGVYVHPWHNMFMSAAMTESDIDFAVDAADVAFASLDARRATLKPHALVSDLLRSSREAVPA